MSWPPLVLRTTNLLGMREKATWSIPTSGVSLLIGQSGSGKSALLRSVAYMQDQLAWCPRQTQHAQPDNGICPAHGLVELSISLGLAKWSMTVGANDKYHKEEVLVGSSRKARRVGDSAAWQRLGSSGTWEDSVSSEHSCLRLLYEAAQQSCDVPDAELMRLCWELLRYRYHDGYATEVLRIGGHKAGILSDPSDTRLSPRGENLFIVLRNWQISPAIFGYKFAWVQEAMRRAFPHVVRRIELGPQVGDQPVPAFFYAPGDGDAISMRKAPDGVLLGLLHLTAVASAEDGGVVAIENMDSGLHPHAIRSILKDIRDLARKPCSHHGPTVVLTTHSPVLMNEFNCHPDSVLAMPRPASESSSSPVPIHIGKCQDWLSHFQLGDLYDRLEIGWDRPSAKRCQH